MPLIAVTEIDVIAVAVPVFVYWPACAAPARPTGRRLAWRILGHSTDTPGSASATVRATTETR